MWEGLWREFELQGRFKNLDFKLEMIQDNTKFFLEAFDTRHGAKLEWYVHDFSNAKPTWWSHTYALCLLLQRRYIIILISVEIVISLYK
jgi:uncharacterized Rmd1/YagE family protein